MLQRAASNAYSWWWASHIRTKHSKWLEENLQDMEEKVNSMLKIIENSGDSFAQRAEMYYRRRPELISHVEDSYRAYRALAERFDHLSKELQSANRTIATVFPEQVQFSMDDDDFDESDPTTFDADNPGEKHKVSKANIPKVPSMPKKDFRSLSSRKGQLLNRTTSAAKANVPPSSGLSREEAVEKIDKLQREILALQTEKEFAQSVSERCHAKCGGIENQITEMQMTISGLQDEFGISNVIDDNEARTLMASTALKSCKNTLVKLQEKQELSAGETKVENQRINEVQKKYTALKGEFLYDQSDLQDTVDEQEAESSEDVGPNNDMMLLREKIKGDLEADLKSSHTMMQLAGRIDELVEKVVTLETAVSSQDALVNRLKSDTDGLHTHIKTLEEDKEKLMENSEKMSNRLRELEEEFRRVKCLNENIKEQNKNLVTRLTEASCTADHLSGKLQTAKSDDEVENEESIQESEGAVDAKADGGIEEEEQQHLQSGNEAFISKATEMEKKRKKDDVSALNSSTKAEESGSSQKLAAIPENHGQKDLNEAHNDLATQLEELGIDEEDQLNWRQLLVSGLDDREKLLLEEYTSVLRNYTEVRKKLGDVEKKNRDGFFELALQIRELKNALALRDEEIQSLREISSHQQNQDENNESTSAKYKYSNPEGSPDRMTQAASFLDSNLSSVSSPQQIVFESEHERHVDPRGRIGELAVSGGNKKYPAKEASKVIKMKRGDSPHVPSAIEEKIRSDIDGLLEENLEFWLRFSTTLHQIRKFQTSLHDLKVELSRIREGRRRDGNDKNPYIISETRPIFAHLREIQTELALWLENNKVMKDEMHSRYASLCNIQDELLRVSNPTSKAEEAELSEYQAAKFQGEILNMKQESNKVADELQVGLDRVRGLKVEVERILKKLDEDLGISAAKHRSSLHKARIPLRSFLFGVKLKKHKGQKQSIFSCTSPALQKQYSMVEAGKPPQHH